MQGGRRPRVLAGPDRLLPNAPTTYQMRDWRQTATDFDTLAFNTTATGQFLPIVRIDNTFQPPQTQTWYGLPAYVGETRTFGETGEPIHEAIASLAAVSAGRLSASTRRQVRTTGSRCRRSTTLIAIPNTLSSIRRFLPPANPLGTRRTPTFSCTPSPTNIRESHRFKRFSTRSTAILFRRQCVDCWWHGAEFQSHGFQFRHAEARGQRPMERARHGPRHGLAAVCRLLAKPDANPTQAAAYLNAVDWSLSPISKQLQQSRLRSAHSFGAYTAARMNAEQGRNYDVQKIGELGILAKHARNTENHDQRPAVGRPGRGRVDGIHDSEHRARCAATRSR